MKAFDYSSSTRAKVKDSGLGKIAATSYTTGESKEPLYATSAEFTIQFGGRVVTPCSVYVEWGQAGPWQIEVYLEHADVASPRTRQRVTRTAIRQSAAAAARRSFSSNFGASPFQHDGSQHSLNHGPDGEDGQCGVALRLGNQHDCAVR